MDRLRAFLAFSSIAAFAFFVAAGCDSDSDSKNGDGSPTAGSSVTATASRAASGASPSSSAGSPAATSTSGAAASPTSGSGGGSLKDATKDLSKATYRISYNVINKDDDGKEHTLHYVAARKPPKSFTSVAEEGSDDSYIFVRDDQFSYFCTVADKSCFKSKVTAGDLDEDLLPSIDPDKVVEEAAKEGTTAKEIAGRTIAGQDARCWEVQDSTGSGTLCVSKDEGITLLLDGTFDGQTSKFEATEYSKSVSDDVFTVPADYEITDIS